MQAIDRVFLPVHVTARRFGVPARWLLSEALAGRIPTIRAGRRLLVHVADAERALAERAAGTCASTAPREAVGCR